MLCNFFVFEKFSVFDQVIFEVVSQAVSGDSARFLIQYCTCPGLSAHFREMNTLAVHSWPSKALLKQPLEVYFFYQTLRVLDA
jgi:hypothetical protein